MGGEKQRAVADMRKAGGSPPRGRGKENHFSTNFTQKGITPAWAGKSDSASYTLPAWKDHPRVGGEKLLVLLSVGWWLGSPPRGRGKALSASMPILGAGITPAWAGKRFPSAPMALGSRDHPRVGGEKAMKVPPCQLVIGSPPRGRGKGSTARPKGLSGRITPAWAGKRPLEIRNKFNNRDHPRVGGEKSISAPNFGPGTGSPPRGRGKVHRYLRGPLPLGITPAWAGKRTAVRGVEKTPRDHPRVGGEKCCSSSAFYIRCGSPPRGRGKGILDYMGVPTEGITPAWAGKRRHQTVKEKKHEDHPRVGGEK